jgi:hypothetical protein
VAGKRRARRSRAGGVESTAKIAKCESRGPAERPARTRDGARAIGAWELRGRGIGKAGGASGGPSCRREVAGGGGEEQWQI